MKTRDNLKLQLIPLLIFALGSILRLIAFGQIPGGVNCDEAMSAVDALALATYGTDRLGVPFPVHLQAWGYGQMSAGLCYLQALCIKLFGFSTVTIRLPLLIFSLLSMWLMYLIGKKLCGERCGIILLALTVASPWHFLQSRWALDCNLFPHIFLLGFYLMLEGTAKKYRLYLSMICFAACFYCYGVAIYTVPLFLLAYGVCLLRIKQVTIKELLLCVLLFLLVALPEILVMAINFFRLPTIHTPLFTLQYFDQSIRSNDILLLHFSFPQLWENIKALCCTAFLQVPGAAYNAPPQFGPMYHISTVFALIGLIDLSRGLVKKRDQEKQPLYLAVLLYFVMAVLAGLLTQNVNVNRVNIIFPVLIILTGMGISRTVKLAGRIIPWHYAGRAMGLAVCVGYLLLFTWFLRYYYFIFQSKVGDSVYSASYLKAIKELDRQEYDALFISCFTGYGADVQVSEILTEYICQLDARYTQGAVNISNSRILLPYQERYHFFYSWDASERKLLQSLETDNDLRVVFLVHQNELDLLDIDYTIAGQSGEFYYLEPVQSESSG